ncbi:hypothetical protein [Yinghuangia seranimata]|uniref:hypothetical protein n=1 Tax=Yinghuangia seranimata TaxID=408067 RepID=UPI00248B4FC8|nr:hypothetical protein [Yinghuangia seranimata]MDI2132057.1 hypothetical protein [Yinghuangia seranimata]
MEPIPAALLLAIADGEAGAVAWAELRGLVGRPSRRSGTSGEAALSALEANPEDPVRAEALSQVLAARAYIDAEFGVALTAWRDTAAEHEHTDADHQVGG